MSKKADTFATFVLDQLRGLEDVRVRPMFGGYGLYRGELFFGIAHRGRLYFRTDAGTRQSYLRCSMGPFRPSERQTLSSYFEVPSDIVGDAQALGATPFKVFSSAS